MQRIIFALICALLLIKPTSSALFLSILGIDYLPLAYLGVAGIALIISLFYNSFVEQKQPRQLFIVSSLISILIFILIAILLLFSIQKNIVVFALYLFVSVFGILSASQFWIISNQIFNARQARKYFGIIGSGAIAGGIAGGYLASIISAIFQSEYILFVTCLFIAYAIIEVLRLDFTREATPEQKSKSTKGGFNQILKPFMLIRQTRHLKLIALMVATSVFVAKLIDYQFGYFATQAFPVEEDLTSFYGFWFSSFNLISLIIQLFLTSRIVGRFGVGHSILILPLILLFGSLALLILPALVLALVIKLFDASLKQSINKASAELIMLPVPEDIKFKTKTFIDVFVDSLATGICGIIILVFINAIDLPNIVVTILILIGTMVWFYWANKLRKEYKLVFRESLKLRSDQVGISNKQLVSQYEAVLENGNPFQKLKTLRLLKNSEIEISRPLIIALLNSEHPDIVIATINNILFDKSDFTQEVRILLNHTNQDVKTSAFEYLINHQEDLETHFLLKHLQSADIEESIMAITAYTKEFGNNPTIMKVLDLRKKILDLTSRYNAHPESFTAYQLVGLLKSISFGKFKEFYPFIYQFLDNPEPLVRNNALIAAGETRSNKYFQIITATLEEDKFDTEVISRALAKFNIGKLERLVRDMAAEDQLVPLRKLPFTFAKIPMHESVIQLENLLEHKDLIVRNNAIQALSELINKYPLLKKDNSEIFSLLVSESKYNNAILKFILDREDEELHNTALTKLTGLLKLKIDSNLKIIFKLLNIIYPPEQYLELYDYVKGPDYTLRNNAIEYLDNALHPDLKSVIVPLIEYNFNHTTPELEDDSLDEHYIKAFLLSNRDPEIREAAKAYYQNLLMS